jgi:hypothetical protein
MDEKTLEMLRQVIEESVKNAVEPLRRIILEMDQDVKNLQLQVNSLEKYIMEQNSKVRTISHMYGELKIDIENIKEDRQ